MSGLSVQLYHGDCMEILPTLADGSVDAVITDPPYNVGLNYGDSVDDMKIDYAEWCNSWVTLASNIAPLVVFTPGIANVTNYRASDWIACWLKGFSGSRGGSIAVVNRWEPILIYGKPHTKLGHDIFESRPECYRAELKGQSLYDTGGHPCPKPVDLYQQIIAKFTMPGDTILDPFMGSGTTGVACMKTGRNFIGIEIEERYFQIATKRIDDARRQTLLPFP